MFSEMVLARNIQLYPQDLGRNYRRALYRSLVDQVEGTYSEQHGLIVAIRGIVSVGAGYKPSWTAFTVFWVRYRVQVFRVFPGETLDAVVSEVSPFGFSSESGPAHIFVSTQGIPEDMKYQVGSESYISADGLIRIEVGTEVRVKIIGTTWEQNELNCVGTIKGTNI